MSPQERLDAGRRIAAARKAARMNQTTLGEKMGVAQSVISDWENGTHAGWRDEEARLEKLLGVPPGYIRDQIIEPDQPPTIDSADLPEMVFAPEYNVYLSAGPGAIPINEEARRFWPLPRFLVVDSLGLDPSRIAMQEIVGDSMAPTLMGGDFVLIDLADRRTGLPGIFAVWDGDALVCKRLEKVAGETPPRIRLKSDNPLHGEYVVLAETVNIVGRVRWCARRT